MARRQTTPSSLLAAARRVMTFVCVFWVASTATSSSCPPHGCSMHSHRHRHHHKSTSSSSSGGGLRRKRGARPSCGGGRRYGHAIPCWATPLGGRIGWLPRMRTQKDCTCSLTTRGMAAERRAPRVAPVRSLLTMKARGKKGRAGGGRRGGNGGATAAAAGRGGTKQKKAALYIQIEDLESDSWRLIEAGNILRKGGVGVIPTDTCYTFACDILSRKGVERILQIKNEQGRHKPLSLLCKDISTMNTYAKGIDKALFKTMKAALPGPFTFILPSTNEVPRMLIEHKHHKKTWKRKEIGIRLPDAPVLLDLLQQLDGPLLCGSVPSGFPGDGAWAEGGAAASDYDVDDDDDEVDGESVSRRAWGDDASVSGDPAAIEAAWGHAVDFVVDAGLLEVGGFSTVVDAIGVEPVVLREGLGDSSLITG
ncbi:unnamed protein product [Ectocarpus fasciculatus]